MTTTATNTVKRNKSTKNRVIFTPWAYVIIIVLIPIVQIAEFFVVQGGTVSDNFVAAKSIIPYLNLALFVFAIMKSRFAWIQLFLACYLGYYILGFDKFSVQNNASYMMPFVSTCSFLLLPLDKEVRLSKLHDKIILCFFLGFIVLYYAIAKEKLFEDRFYLVGFVIPHQFCYYCAILTMYYLSKDKILLSGIISIAGIYVGVRSGLLAIIFVYLYYSPKLWDKYKRKSIWIFVSLAIGGLFIIQQKDGGKNQNRIEALFDQTFNVGKKSQSDYTASRSDLWSNVYEYTARTWFSPETLTGHGPKSSYLFNQNTLGIGIWMHNDFIEVFFTLGLLGIYLYLSSLVKFYNSTKTLLFLGFIVILILTNGFFTYTPLTMILFFRIIYANNYQKTYENEYSEKVK